MKPARDRETRLAPPRALVLCPVLGSPAARKTKAGNASPPDGANDGRSPEARLAEAEGLARAIRLDVCESGIVPLSRPKPGTLFGAGKVEEIRGICAAENADLAVVDHPLSPVQQRNLERAWKVKVLDRTGLILEIFGERAQTREGRLQVDLAHLVYQKSRLVRSWTHLERQRGGVGFMGGPGETQIEADRRALQERIVRIRKELDQVKRTRGLHRESRRRVPYAVVALVGYTNAGKSTLFNRLTGAGVSEQDMLFATLDPTMREIELPQGTRAILSDTVGFISNLPTSLVAAFRATLEEVLEADLILHVRDIASGESEAQRADVEKVLADLGVDTLAEDGRLIEVWNKTDLLNAERLEEVRNTAARIGAWCVSARTGAGLDGLLAAVEARLNASGRIMNLTLEPHEGALMNWLHENTQVLSMETGEHGRVSFELRVSPAREEQLKRRLERRPASAGTG